MMDPTLNMFALLYWFVEERNWTVQNTSTIVKPRREPDEYAAGDVVTAKFKGKPYRAVVVRVTENKEDSVADRLKLDSLLKDSSLLPANVLKRMGVPSQNLEAEFLNTKVPENSKQEDTAQKQKKRKECPAQKPEKKSDHKPKSKDTAKKQKLADQKQQRDAAVEASKLTATKIFSQTTTKVTDPQPISFTASTIETPSYTHQMEVPFNTGLQTMNQAWQQQRHFQQDTWQPQYDWPDYSNSASTYMAEKFSTPLPEPGQSSCDCSNEIKALLERVACIEEKLSNYGQWNTYSNLNQPTNYDTEVSSPSECFDTSQPQQSQTVCSTGTSESVSQVPVDPVTQNDNSPEVDLVPGYHIKISVKQLDVCLRKAKSSATALTRLLLVVFFSDEELSKSSAKGTKHRPALPSTTIAAIIKFVSSKFPNATEREITQAINCKCAETRQQLKQKCDSLDPDETAPSSGYKLFAKVIRISPLAKYNEPWMHCHEVLPNFVWYSDILEDSNGHQGA